MSVLASPRPPAPEHPQTEVERRRAQEALIKEARRRARQRRQRTAALLLLGAFLAMAIGPAHLRGGHEHGSSSSAVPMGQTKGAVRNGKIAFADGLGQLKVVDLDGSADVIAHCPGSSRGCALEQPAWSPDGRKIAYVSGSAGLTPGPRGYHPLFLARRPRLSLYIKDADGGRVRRLVGCGSCAKGLESKGIAWSPDGSWIAFSRDRIAFSRDSGPQVGLSLWLVNTATGKLRRLTDCRAQPCVDISPAWAPDGRLIVFSRLAAGGSSLYTVRRDGSHLTKITDSPSAEHPQWSPDGRRIAYDGDDQIFVMDADGSNRQLLFAGRGDGDGPGIPSWSPDGTQIAFFNTPREPNRFFSAEVWTISPDSTEKTRLYHSACCVMNWAAPIWSPDGQKLAFATTSARGIFVIAPDGSELHRISNATTSALSWQRLP